MRRIATAIALVGLLLAVGCTRTPSPATTAAAPASPAPDPGARTPRAPREAVAPEAAARAPQLADLVGADDTFDTLHARYGDAVRRDTLAGAEGDEIPGWVLYPDDPARRVEIYPDASGTHPDSLTVRDASTWAREDGVRIGLTVAELEALNGRPFVFSGFGWDYGGTVTDWKGGRLAHDGRFVGPVTLCEPDGAPADYPSGDGDFESSLPILRMHPAKVCTFGVQVAPAE